MEADSPQWSSKAIEIVDSAFFLISCSILAVLLSKRVPHHLDGWKRMPFAKIYVVWVLLASYLFILFSSILLFGISTKADSTCSFAIWLCILLYATSKIGIYIFLVERVYLVNSKEDGGQISRIKSTTYRVCLVFILAWAIVAVLMIAAREAYVRSSDTACVIGLKLWATVPMLVLDAVVNLYLTMSFILPLYRSRFDQAKNLSRRSLWAALIALTTSALNVAILALMHGKQRSFVCLSSCGLDVTVNACMIFWVTKGERDLTPTVSFFDLSISETGSRYVLGTLRKDSLPPETCKKEVSVLVFPLPSKIKRESRLNSETTM